MMSSALAPASSAVTATVRPSEAAGGSLQQKKCDNNQKIDSLKRQ